MEWVVVAAGEMRCRPFWERLLKQPNNVLCADAGLNHCIALGIRPMTVIGDLDSLGEVPQGYTSQPYPQEKAQSDSQLAIEEAFRRGATHVYLLGGTGGRLDHTYANFKLLRHFSERLTMCDGDFEARAIHSTYQFNAQPGETLSIFPIGCDQAELTTQGLQYPLRYAQLRADSQGVSNVVTESQVSITIHQGHVLLFRVWEPGTDRQSLGANKL